MYVLKKICSNNIQCIENSKHIFLIVKFEKTGFFSHFFFRDEQRRIFRLTEMNI